MFLLTRREVKKLYRYFYVYRTRKGLFSYIVSPDCVSKIKDIVFKMILVKIREYKLQSFYVIVNPFSID